jgi:hypothetical protein
MIKPLLLVAALAAGCSTSAPAATPHIVVTDQAITPAAERPPPYPGKVKAFGNGWSHVRGNCDTREIILERDSSETAVDTDGDGCRDDGTLYDIYTGNAIRAQQAQIDHVYSEGEAWYAGAWRWSLVQRRIFSQDQSNLRAVTGSVNESKGDRSPASWRPPARSGWCSYQMIYRTTANRWRLDITPAADAALREMATTCPR